MEGDGMKSPGTLEGEADLSWGDAKVWLFSVWYNKCYEKSTSYDEIEHCWSELLKCDFFEVSEILTHPEKHFPEAEFDHLTTASLDAVVAEWRMRLSEQSTKTKK